MRIYTRPDDAALGSSAAGAVAVVAAFACATDRVVGLAVSSFVTLSLEPPLVMMAIQHSAGSYPSLVSSRAFGVSLLHTGQAAITALFATKGADKTSTTTLEAGASLHVPLIPGASAHVECLTGEIVMSGDHAIVVGLVEAARVTGRQPLLYHARRSGMSTPLGPGGAPAGAHRTYPRGLAVR